MNDFYYRKLNVYHKSMQRIKFSVQQFPYPRISLRAWGASPIKSVFIFLRWQMGR